MQEGLVSLKTVKISTVLRRQSAHMTNACNFDKFDNILKYSYSQFFFWNAPLCHTCFG